MYYRKVNRINSGSLPDVGLLTELKSRVHHYHQQQGKLQWPITVLCKFVIVKKITVVLSRLNFFYLHIDVCYQYVLKIVMGIKTV